MKSKVYLIGAMLAAAPSLAQAVEAPNPDHTWEYSPENNGVYYGTPETDDVVVSMVCKGGAVEISLPFDYSPMPNRESAANISFKNLTQISERFSLSKMLEDDELIGWSATATVNPRGSLIEFLKGKGEAEVSAGFQYRISLKGAAQAIESLQANCRPSQDAEETEKQPDYTLTCDRVVERRDGKPKVRRLKKPIVVAIRFSGSLIERREWGSDMNGGWGWASQRYYDLTLTLDGHSVAGGAVFGSTYEASKSYDGQFEWAYSRELNDFTFSNGVDRFHCRHKPL